MTLDEIYSKLKSLNIPVAYLQFQKPQKLPFIAYYESHTVVKGADNYNLFRQEKSRFRKKNRKPFLQRRNRKKYGFLHQRRKYVPDCVLF